VVKVAKRDVTAVRSLVQMYVYWTVQITSVYSR